MNNSDKKKPLLSGALTGDDNKGFASANADEHNDRITRFATLKHRAKNQENYLFSLAQFKDNYEKDVKNEESIKALKSAQKLNECGNYLLFKNFYTIGEVKLSSSAPVDSICFVLSALLSVHLVQFKNTLNVSIRFFKRIASSSLF